MNITSKIYPGISHFPGLKQAGTSGYLPFQIRVSQSTLLRVISAYVFRDPSIIESLRLCSPTIDSSPPNPQNHIPQCYIRNSTTSLGSLFQSTATFSEFFFFPNTQPELLLAQLKDIISCSTGIAHQKEISVDVNRNLST